MVRVTPTSNTRTDPDYRFVLARFCTVLQLKSPESTQCTWSGSVPWSGSGPKTGTRANSIRECGGGNRQGQRSYVMMRFYVMLNACQKKKTPKTKSRHNAIAGTALRRLGSSVQPGDGETGRGARYSGRTRFRRHLHPRNLWRRLAAPRGGRPQSVRGCPTRAYGAHDALTPAASAHTLPAVASRLLPLCSRGSSRPTLTRKTGCALPGYRHWRMTKESVMF